MKLRVFVVTFLTVISSCLLSWPILYAEQFYELYHRHFYQYPDDTIENIYYLEAALKADFANPLYAVAKIENKIQWERYRYLFKMHVNLKLIQLHLTLGSKYDKMKAYFYNAPWKYQNIDSLNTAEQVYRKALLYWDEVLEWSKKAWEIRYIHLKEIYQWEDENYRIEQKELDYEEIIGSQIERLQEVRNEFQNMDENTY